jgi:UrcA family protein
MIALRTAAFISAVALCSAGLPASSMAATSGPDVSEVSVPTADLDLHTAHGVATLRQRIRVAAKTVCMEALPNASASSDLVRMCRIEAAQHALPAVKSAVIAR